jgi:putative tryptophan/tyrosine transport system substrate-binding protein
MKRRVFIAGLGGAAAWPLVAGAQPIERMRRIAVLVDAPQDDRSRPRVAAFIQGLMDLGWSEGRNAQIHIRWGANNSERSRSLAAELLALDPDVVLASGSPATAAMRQASAAIPIVFALVTDPVGAGLWTAWLGLARM